MTDDALAFMGALLDGVPDEMFALLWTLQNKESHWIRLGDGGSTAVAEAAAALSAQNMDAYIAVSVARAGGGSHRRIASDNSAGLMGLWADIDIADPDIHKKYNLPPDEKAALELLERSGVEPSLIVHSGHGLQAWWLFDEFWEFENEADRLGAADLAHRWNATLRARAAEKSWTIDSTFDLARVMRIPGTTNRKGDPVMPVRLIADSGRRYGREDFDQFCLDETVIAQMGISSKRDYVLEDMEQPTENASPDAEMLDALRENDPVFERTWLRTRKDLPDQSQSSYDLSLMNILTDAGWSDLEIWKAIIAHRRKHGQDMKKAVRRDYIASTLGKARSGRSHDKAIEDIDTVVVGMEEAKRVGDPDAMREKRSASMNTVSDLFGLEVNLFTRYLGDPEQFAITTPDRTVSLGEIRGLSSQGAFRDRILSDYSHLIPTFKATQWADIIRLISSSWVDQHIGAEATDSGQVETWLSEYLQSRPPIDDTGDIAALTEHPFVKDGETHIFISSFKRWLSTSRNENLTHTKLGRMLRQYGCKPDKVHVQVEGSRTTRSVWILPPGSRTP